MGNAIDSNLQRGLLLQQAMIAFKQSLLPLGLFSTNFNTTVLEGKREVRVPYYPLATSESKDFDGTYKFDKGEVQSKAVNINKRKYQSLTKSSDEVATNSALDWGPIWAAKAQKLAADVISDIFSVITTDNFGSAVLDTTAANFDLDDLIDIETAIDSANWPDTQRGLILKGAWLGAVKKSILSNKGISSVGINPLTKELPDILSFKLARFNNFAGKVAGVAVHPSAILVGMSPIPPCDDSLNKVIDYDAYTDPETGLTLEYRKWGSPDNDICKETIECNYGYAVGDSSALKIITDGTE